MEEEGTRTTGRRFDSEYKKARAGQPEPGPGIRCFKFDLSPTSEGRHLVPLGRELRRPLHREHHESCPQWGQDHRCI